MENKFWHQNTLEDNQTLKKILEASEQRWLDSKEPSPVEDSSVEYSFDGKAVLRAIKKDITEYTINPCAGLICPHAFENCTKLAKIIFPYNFVAIRHHAFAFCESIDNIILSEHTNLLDDLAFEGCTSLKTITLPASLEIVGKDVFKDCKSLQCINVPAGTRSKFCRLFNDIFVMDRIGEV